MGKLMLPKTPYVIREKVYDKGCHCMNINKNLKFVIKFKLNIGFSVVPASKQTCISWQRDVATNSNMIHITKRGATCFPKLANEYISSQISFL